MTDRVSIRDVTERVEALARLFGLDLAGAEPVLDLEEIRITPERRTGAARIHGAVRFEITAKAGP